MRDTNKESKILSILYWRTTCKKLLTVLQELNKIKHDVANKALASCNSALDTFRDNNRKRRNLLKMKQRKEREDRIPR